MNFQDKKFIVFINNENKDNVLGMKHYVKFLDDKRSQAFFFSPLIAPRNMKEIIKANNILEAYEINNENILEQYMDEVYTFVKKDGIYEVHKGVLEETKYIYLVDNWMDPQFNLPRFSYEIKEDKIILTSDRLSANKGTFCYVVLEKDLNPTLEPYMIRVTEKIPGHLKITPSINPPCKILKPGTKNKSQ